MEEQRVGSFRFLIDFSQPLYEQILNQVRSSIAKGEIEMGSKMPSVRDLAQELRMNPNTVMRAYQELERDGLTEKRRGLGTYVTSSSERIASFREQLAMSYIDQFLGQMSSLGLSWEDVQQYIRSRQDGDHKEEGEKA
ncbi:GntR family transcriptional regulator [Paenibacillus polymyxa]|jgi:GntR family transcriptional regulator|uniref:GntR family transcriptional regulator n=1 Tax=Paenibacillus TaxID=44249 RepID=UPI0002F07AF2|nr:MULTISPECIES: GntR family transcriptional regulator [Paenibacillus]AHM64020.1 GntR family transcriptional regulator [Paenibacillus polymyxa SQR-21]KAF6562116.1 GntR family transcriptional regulator [Paenibacillus sp. EKM202P]KAF6566482.1 GntR family transcriptional regulator [Paenibacillus sp. EKM207P]KAF6583651.1 GntR family transcriptional regulator [Paenibacillus sp. EKM211P]KKD56606.1 GntR family transcriptional regulator [Paenibacillus sp. ICGEB2008]